MSDFKEYKPMDVEHNVQAAVENLRTAYWSNETEKVAIAFTEAESIIVSAICHDNYTVCKPYDDSGDLISRKYIEGKIEELENICQKMPDYVLEILSDIKNAPTVDFTNNQAYDKGFITAMKLYARPQGEWIHITSRPMTDEEYEHYSSEIGDCPKEECRVYSCQMPEDCEEVLITTRWGKVCEDIYHHDTDGSFFEDHDDPDDVIAWMKKPQPFSESEVQHDSL